VKRQTKDPEFESIVQRLTEHPSAAVRAHYLTHLQGIDADDPRIRRLREKACAEEPLRSMLKHRNRAGWWYEDTRNGIYKKYEGTVWSLLFAAELGAPPDHPQFRESCAYFLDRCYEPKHGAFSSNGQVSHTIACFVAHACYFLTHFGFGDDERVRNGFLWLSHNFDEDGGMKCFVMDSALLSGCVMALPKFLKATALLSKRQRNALPNRAVERALEKLLEIRLDRYQPVEVTGWNQLIEAKSIAEIRELKKKQKLSGETRAKSSWSRFQFPLHYDSDLLEVMLCFARHGVKSNETLLEGARRIGTLRTESGWRHGRTLNGKMWGSLADQDDWITMRALEVLKAYPSPGGTGNHAE